MGRQLRHEPHHRRIDLRRGGDRRRQHVPGPRGRRAGAATYRPAVPFRPPRGRGEVLRSCRPRRNDRAYVRAAAARAGASASWNRAFPQLQHHLAGRCHGSSFSSPARAVLGAALRDALDPRQGRRRHRVRAGASCRDPCRVQRRLRRDCGLRHHLPRRALHHLGRVPLQPARGHDRHRRDLRDRPVVHAAAGTRPILHGAAQRVAPSPAALRDHAGVHRPRARRAPRPARQGDGSAARPQPGPRAAGERAHPRPRAGEPQAAGGHRGARARRAHARRHRAPLSPDGR